MRALLPRLSFLLRRCAYIAAFDALKKLACQLTLAGMALAVNRTQIEELIA